VLPPFAPTDAEVRREIIAGAIERTDWRGRRIFRAYLVAYSHWFGAVCLLAGLGLTGAGLAKHKVTTGPAAIFIGLGWIACNRIPIQRAQARQVAIAAVMVAGILLESAAKAAGWMSR
jgi:hypothetical protein